MKKQIIPAKVKREALSIAGGLYSRNATEAIGYAFNFTPKQVDGGEFVYLTDYEKAKEKYKAFFDFKEKCFIIFDNPKSPTELLREYVFACIEDEDRDGKPLATEKGKIEAVLDAFFDEYDNAWNKRQYPNTNDRLASFLQGMGGPIALDHHYTDIIRLGKSFGYQMKTEGGENTFCDKWFTACAHALVIIARKNGLSFDRD